MSTASNKKAILERIQKLEDAIAKGREYLETDAHADWDGFRPLFTPKVRSGQELPPHKDWVRNVFIPRREQGLRREEKKLERLDSKSRSRAAGLSRRRPRDE